MHGLTQTHREGRAGGAVFPSGLSGLLFALLAVLPAAALAQVNPVVPNQIWPGGLSDDDISRMGAAAARLYEGHAIGDVERWRNPDTGNAGLVRLTRRFESNGAPCRTLQYVIRVAKRPRTPAHYRITWCKLNTGEWKIVEAKPENQSGKNP